MIVLKVYELDDLSSAIPITLEDDKCYCDHNLNGADTLTFEIQRKNENHISIAEEVKVDAFGNRFVIKKIDEHSDFTTVNCELDLDDWKAKINKNYRAVNESITNVMQNVIPDGWTITYGTGVDTTSRGTVEKQEGKAFIAATSLELLDYISNAFSVVFNFYVLSKTITVINTDAFTSSGEFFMEDLNMTELGYNGDSTNFITRVYAYGKDGLTFADINDGKEYVENSSYSNKVINYVLIDERYTVKENLLQYAQKVLNEKCIPQKSYTCSIKNFDGDVWLYKIVTIVDQRRKTRVEHQCVKYREYNDHSLDSITLSSQAPSIEKIVSDNAKTTNDLIAEQSTYIFGVLQNEIEEATAKITGSQGGYFKWIYDADGRPIELVNLGDTKDINTAQKVWRWNQGGLGHSNNGYNGTYDLALTNDGKINASMITTGILNAGVIRAGIIQDLQGSNFWNLETGAFSLSANATVGGSTVSSIAQTEAEAAVNAQTQLSIFNKLTNNGATQGIYLYNNLLYLNGAYLKANSVSADVIYGGSLTLGGANNINGRLYVKDGNGETIGRWDKDGAVITGLLKMLGDTTYCTIGNTPTYVNYVVEGIVQRTLENLQFVIPYDSNGHMRAMKTFVKADTGNIQEILAIAGTIAQRLVVITTGSYLPEINTSSDVDKIRGYEERVTYSLTNGAVYRIIPLIGSGHDTGLEIYKNHVKLGKFTCDGEGRIGTNRELDIPPNSSYATIDGNTIAYVSSSSKRYKHDINKTLTGDREPVNLLNLPVAEFVFNDDHPTQYADMKGKIIPGIIAEDVAEFYPSAVIYNDKGEVESWDERRLIPAIISLIQKHENKINYILDNILNI